MPRAYALALTVAAMVCGGCVFPVPHIKQTCGPIQGVVVDEETNRPVSGAEINVYYSDGGHRRTFTDPTGGFRFSSKHRFHYAYVFGVALNYSLPYDIGWSAFTAVTVEKEGCSPIYLCGPHGYPLEEVYDWISEYQRSEISPEPSEDAKPLNRASWTYARITLAPRASP